MNSRAPFIPMDAADELSLNPTAHAKVMWGALPDHLTMLHPNRRPSPTSQQQQQPQQQQRSSSLATLLGRNLDCSQKDRSNIDQTKPIVDQNRNKISQLRNGLKSFNGECNLESVLESNNIWSDGINGKRQPEEGDVGLNGSTNKRAASPGIAGNAKRARSRRPLLLSQPPPPPAGSVLMNLLVSGCDVSAGYICLVQGRPKQKH